MAFTERTDTGLLVPDGFLPPVSGGQVLIDNRSDLPDGLVRHAVATHFEENVGSFGSPGGYQMYPGGDTGSLLARPKWTMPGSVFDEIRLARDLAVRDDDIRSTLGAIIGVAYQHGMEHFAEDSETEVIFNRLARHGKFDGVFKNLLLEYMIAQQVTTVSLYTRQTFEFTHPGVTRTISRTLAAPYIGIIPAENVRVIGDDMFGNAPLAYVPDSRIIREWLEAYFAKSASPAKRAELARQQPVWAALFLEKITVPNNENLLGSTIDAYRMNPLMVNRTKAPCTGAYPRPLMTANFALLEAKRLLNLLDHSYLVGGVNFLVVAKKGSDKLPGQPEEIANLREVLRRSSRSGVIVGDHRLDIEIITPELTEVLSPTKRKLIGKQLSATLLRVPPIEEGGSSEGEKTVTELVTAVITGDRNDLKRHMETIYADTVARNPALREPAKIWFQKIVLQGLNYFNELILKLNDRGAIPRKYAVEAGGFPYEAAVSQRQREAELGHDEIMAPPQIPFDSPNKGPQDNSTDGRPRAGNEPDPASPRRLIRRTRGETIKAEYDDELEQVVRFGELTAAILEQFPDHIVGRVTATERKALESGATFQEGATIVVPVNSDYETDDERAVRLGNDVSLLVGRTRRGAIVTRALCFRDDSYTIAQAEDRAIAWGFFVEPLDERKAPDEA